MDGIEFFADDRERNVWDTAYAVYVANNVSGRFVKNSTPYCGPCDSDAVLAANIVLRSYRRSIARLATSG